MGDIRIVDGEKQIYIDGFGWIEDEGGSVGTMVGNPGNELTGNKVSIMGGGTTVDGKGDINKQVGVMVGGDTPANNTPVPGTKKVHQQYTSCVGTMLRIYSVQWN